ncbi:MAG: hypothetical protein U9N52_03160 [Campylobacterota bacterium]|nr:hypothetical protein [Campylobacterota bacterium]
MHTAVIQNYHDFPQKIVDLKWLELELHRISAEHFDLKWNTHRQCIEHDFKTEEEYQILHRWSEHVGANLEVHAQHAYIYC